MRFANVSRCLSRSVNPDMVDALRSASSISSVALSRLPSLGLGSPLASPHLRSEGDAVVAERRPALRLLLLALGRVLLGQLGNK